MTIHDDVQWTRPALNTMMFGFTVNKLHINAKIVLNELMRRFIIVVRVGDEEAIVTLPAPTDDFTNARSMALIEARRMIVTNRDVLTKALSVLERLSIAESGD